MIGFTITQDDPGRIAYNTLLTLQIALDFGQNVRLSPKLATLLSRRAGNDVKMIAPEVWRNMSKGETMLYAMPLLDTLLHNGLVRREVKLMVYLPDGSFLRTIRHAEYAENDDLSDNN